MMKKVLIKHVQLLAVHIICIYTYRYRHDERWQADVCINNKDDWYFRGEGLRYDSYIAV